MILSSDSAFIGARWRALAATAAMLISAGCGSGSGSLGQISECSLDSFTPNYAHNVANLLTWPSFPIRVFFIQDANFSTNRKNIAINGFDQWVTASASALSFQVVISSSTADVTVKFDPTTSNGLTELHFTGLQMQSADMTIGTRDLLSADIRCVAAHEFGHALGINGHSDDPNDLMHAVHVVGDSCPVTQRDLNTMKTGYCGIFTRAAHIRTRGTGPVMTVRIQ